MLHTRVSAIGTDDDHGEEYCIVSTVCRYQLFLYWIRSGIIKELDLDLFFIWLSCQSR